MDVVHSSEGAVLLSKDAVLGPRSAASSARDILRAANEDPGRFRATSRYVVVVGVRAG